MGQLSNIQTSPVYVDTVLSTKKKFKFRGYNAGQEQALITAKETDDIETIIESIKQVIKECTLDTLNVEELASVDIEWILLKLRAKSVGEEIEVPLECKNEKCKKSIDCTINIDQIKKPEIPKNGNVVKLSEDLQLVMKYPGFDILESLSAEQTTMFDLIASLVQTVINKEQVIETVELDPEEVVQFIKNMSSKTIRIIIDDFIMKIPKISHEIKVLCPYCKEESEYKFEGIKNFFG